jgi:nucleotide-binding universal stress UspA family protein
MRNILVTIDFRENEYKLTDKAIELAKMFDSKIWLIHIVAPDPDFIGYEVGPQYIRDYTSEIIRDEHKKLHELATILKGQGINADGLLMQGPTIEMIIEESNKLYIDLIITGHHEHGFFYRTFVESVSVGILNKSKIPILVVPLD